MDAELAPGHLLSTLARRAPTFSAPTFDVSVLRRKQTMMKALDVCPARVERRQRKCPRWRPSRIDGRAGSIPVEGRVPLAQITRERVRNHQGLNLSALRLGAAGSAPHFVAIAFGSRPDAAALAPGSPRTSDKQGELGVDVRAVESSGSRPLPTTCPAAPCIGARLSFGNGSTNARGITANEITTVPIFLRVSASTNSCFPFLRAPAWNVGGPRVHCIVRAVTGSFVPFAGLIGSCGAGRAWPCARGRTCSLYDLQSLRMSCSVLPPGGGTLFDDPATEDRAFTRS